MATILELQKRSFNTLVITINKQVSPTSSISAYDLSSATGEFLLAKELNSAPLLRKTSLSADQILFTSATAGQLECYITESDLKKFNPGKYIFNLFIKDVLGHTFCAATESILIKETINNA